MFERQFQHYLLLAALLVGVGVAVSQNDSLLAGQFLGISTGTWLAVAFAVPILHQLYVWFVWRAEFHHALISRWFGMEKGFWCYAVGFFIFFLARPISLILVALSNKDSLDLNPLGAVTLAVVLFIPWLYLLYSVHKYFGIDRALSMDHFDPSYRIRPFVREGIFRYTDNAMYTFAILILWILGLVFFSQAALLVALFNHLYIWVHYYCTELPDIYAIYGKKVKEVAEHAA
jgi:hypothetical protein